MSTASFDWTPAAARAASLEVYLLGTVDFDAAIALQERLVYEISGRADQQGVLLLCEHPPVISMGREASRSHVIADPHDLAACEIDVRWVARGGGAFVHAPGQLAVYPILPLDRLGCGLMSLRERLEVAVADTCRDVLMTVKRTIDSPGVWCRGGQLASFGAAVKSWVSYHGAYLNVSPDHSFLSMVESSPVGERLTSLEAQLKRRVPMHRVRESVIQNVASAFDYDRFHIYTGHPLLKRTSRKVCQHA